MLRASKKIHATSEKTYGRIYDKRGRALVVDNNTFINSPLMASRRRNQAAAAPIALGRPRIIRAVLMTEIELDVFKEKYQSPENIERTWSLELTLCESPTTMANLVFATMIGATNMLEDVQGAMQNSFGQNISVERRPTREALEGFLEDPFERYDDIPPEASIVISVRNEDRWIEWITVQKVGSALFRCYAARDFRMEEIVSVFTGHIIWKSNIAYKRCQTAERFFTPDNTETPIAYTRAPDGTIQAVQAGGSHLLLAGACCRTDSEADPNLSLTDAGEYVAISPITTGDELVVQGNRVLQQP